MVSIVVPLMMSFAPIAHHSPEVLSMRRFLGLGAALVVSGLTVAAPAPKTEPVVHISLKGHTNVKMDQNLHSETYPNNNLNALPRGKRKMGEITFEIGDGILQLGSASVGGKPEKIEGIAIGRTAKKLHFLQACGYSTDDGTVIGKYVIHFDDKSTVDVPIEYGKDVVDWWAYPTQKAPSKGKAVWEGENEASKGFEAKIKLYAMTWDCPHPTKKIVKLDFVATKPEQASAPFCVAITLEDK